VLCGLVSSAENRYHPHQVQRSSGGPVLMAGMKIETDKEETNERHSYCHAQTYGG
jgi:hypothetical protein